MSVRAKKSTPSGRLCVLLLGLLLGVVAWAYASPAKAEPGPGGGLEPDRLWVNATLGQPAGSGSGGGPRTGWAIRYRRLGIAAQCFPYRPAGVSGSLGPWYGVAGAGKDAAEVIRVDRATGIQESFGLGCLAPGDLRSIPTPTEVLAALDIDRLGLPQVNSSPQARSITGMQSWFWTPTDGEADAQVVLNGFTVQATADATFHWSTGDDGSYETGTGGTPQNPAVRHIYNSKSPSTGYIVTLDMIWQGEYNWFGFGDAGAGQLGPVTRSGTRSYPVNEVRSVLQ
jgi:hypothetical protein